MNKILPWLGLCTILLVGVAMALLSLGSQDRHTIQPQKHIVVLAPEQEPLPSPPKLPHNIVYPLTVSSPGILSPLQLWQNKEHLLEKQIIVEGTVGMFGNCTKNVCEPGNQCCNTCSGGPKIIVKDHTSQYGIPMKGFLFKGQAYTPKFNGIYLGKNITCAGNECTPNCYPFTYGKNYRITGVVKAQPRLVEKEYYLFLRKFEPLKHQHHDGY